MFKKIITFFLSFCFVFEQVGFAQVAGQLDISSRMSSMYNSMVFEKYRPLHLRYLSYDQLNNDFKLLLDKGSTKENKPEVLEKATAELLKYFFIGIALPNDAFWVNLRPDSPKEIIDENLAKTDIGKVMLECDLQLKKDTAKYTSPETLEGRAYWDKLYKRAEELYGSENITIPTLTRPWIVPDEIIVREAKGSAYIYKATLKVMLEQDYLKGNSNYSFPDEKSKILNEYSSQIIRETIIPKLTREVNSSKRYSELRQVYYSLILAQWFKQSQKDTKSQVTSKIDAKDLSALTSNTKWDKSSYFKAYQKSFKDGEYNVRESRSSAYGQTIRTYFSGGTILDMKDVLGAPGSVMSVAKFDPGAIKDSVYLIAAPGEEITKAEIEKTDKLADGGSAQRGNEQQNSKAFAELQKIVDVLALDVTLNEVTIAKIREVLKGFNAAQLEELKQFVEKKANFVSNTAIGLAIGTAWTLPLAIIGSASGLLAVPLTLGVVGFGLVMGIAALKLTKDGVRMLKVPSALNKLAENYRGGGERAEKLKELTGKNYVDSETFHKEGKMADGGSIDTIFDTVIDGMFYGITALGTWVMTIGTGGAAAIPAVGALFGTGIAVGVASRLLFPDYFKGGDFAGMFHAGFIVGVIPVSVVTFFVGLVAQYSFGEVALRVAMVGPAAFYTGWHIGAIVIPVIAGLGVGAINYTKAAVGSRIKKSSQPSENTGDKLADGGRYGTQIEEKDKGRLNAIFAEKEDELVANDPKYHGPFGRSMFDGLTEDDQETVRMQTLNALAEEKYGPGMGPRYEIINGQVVREDPLRDGGDLEDSFGLTRNFILFGPLGLLKYEAEKELAHRNSHSSYTASRKSTQEKDGGRYGEVIEGEGDKARLNAIYSEKEDELVANDPKYHGPFGRSMFDGLTEDDQERVRMEALNAYAEEKYGPGLGPRYEIINGQVVREDPLRDGGSSDPFEGDEPLRDQYIRDLHFGRQMGPYEWLAQRNAELNDPEYRRRQEELRRAMEDGGTIDLQNINAQDKQKLIARLVKADQGKKSVTIVTKNGRRWTGKLTIEHINPYGASGIPFDVGYQTDLFGPGVNDLKNDVEKGQLRAWTKINGKDTEVTFYWTTPGSLPADYTVIDRKESSLWGLGQPFEYQEVINYREGDRYYLSSAYRVVDAKAVLFDGGENSGEDAYWKSRYFDVLVEEEEKMADKTGRMYIIDGIRDSDQAEVEAKVKNRINEEKYGEDFGPRYEVVNGRVREIDMSRDGGEASVPRPRYQREVPDILTGKYAWERSLWEGRPVKAEYVDILVKSEDANIKQQVKYAAWQNGFRAEFPDALEQSVNKMRAKYGDMRLVDLSFDLVRNQEFGISFTAVTQAKDGGDIVAQFKKAGLYDRLLDSGRFRFESIQRVDLANMEAAIKAINTLGISITPQTIFYILDMINTESNLKQFAAVTGFEAIRGVAIAKMKEKTEGKLNPNFLGKDGMITAFRTWMILTEDVGAMIDLSRATPDNNGTSAQAKDGGRRSLRTSEQKIEDIRAAMERYLTLETIIRETEIFNRAEFGSFLRANDNQLWKKWIVNLENEGFFADAVKDASKLSFREKQLLAAFAEYLPSERKSMGFELRKVNSLLVTTDVMAEVNKLPLVKDYVQRMQAKDGGSAIGQEQEKSDPGKAAASESATAQSPLGGIDFRALPIITQPMGEILMKEIINMPKVNIADLDQEWRALQKMVETETCPSTERIKEFLGACYQKGELKQRSDKILACLAGILRIEEDEYKATEPQVKVMLALLEYNR